MSIELLILFLFAGVPYYLLFEKNNILGKDKVFLFTAFLVLCGIILTSFVSYEITTVMIVVSLLTALISLYKANKTTNLYKLSTYVLFFNSPMLIMFEIHNSILFTVSLLTSLFGVYLMGKYYERSYGSANYRSISGITLVTPFAGLFLTIYFTALALYPPFPNSLFFLNAIMNSNIDLFWLLTTVIIFFGNFLIAVRVMAKTVFGKPNTNIHYIDLSIKGRILHFTIVLALLILSIVALGELF